MLKAYLVALAKNADFFYDKQTLIKFVKPWYRVD